MGENQLICSLLDKYANLMRIINSENPKQEAELQLEIVRTILHSIGVSTTKLD